MNRNRQKVFFEFSRFSDPNGKEKSRSNVDTTWKNFRHDEHNYIVFELNEIRNEKNYFDSMYEFWSRAFQIERNGGCKTNSKQLKDFLFPILIFVSILILATISLLIFKSFEKIDFNRRSRPETISEL